MQRNVCRGQTRSNSVYVRRFDNASLVLASYDPETPYRGKYSRYGQSAWPFRSNLVSTVFSRAKRVSRSVRELARENGIRLKVACTWRNVTCSRRSNIFSSRAEERAEQASSRRLLLPARIKLSRYRYICVSFERSSNTFSRVSVLRRQKKKKKLSTFRRVNHCVRAFRAWNSSGCADCSRSFPLFTSCKEELAVRTKIDER